MALSGAIAGLAGLSEVYGYSGKLKEGFAAGAGLALAAKCAAECHLTLHAAVAIHHSTF